MLFWGLIQKLDSVALKLCSNQSRSLMEKKQAIAGRGARFQSWRSLYRFCFGTGATETRYEKPVTICTLSLSSKVDHHPSSRFQACWKSFRMNFESGYECPKHQIKAHPISGCNLTAKLRFEIRLSIQVRPKFIPNNTHRLTG